MPHDDDRDDDREVGELLPNAILQEGIVDEGLRRIPGLGTAGIYFGQNVLGLFGTVASEIGGPILRGWEGVSARGRRR